MRVLATLTLLLLLSTPLAALPLPGSPQVAVVGARTAPAPSPPTVGERGLPYVNWTDDFVTLDGIFNANEWADASVRQIGLGGQDVLLYVMYDASNIYVAIQALSDLTGDPGGFSGSLTPPESDWVLISLDGNNTGQVDCYDGFDDPVPTPGTFPITQAGSCVYRGNAGYGDGDGFCGYWNANIYNLPVTNSLWQAVAGCNQGLAEPYAYIDTSFGGYRAYEFSIPYSGVGDSLGLAEYDTFGLAVIVNDARDVAVGTEIGRYPANTDGVDVTTPLTLTSAPYADVTSPLPDSTFYVDEPVSFDGRNSLDRKGSITSYQWTFGDGDTSVDDNPSHVYTAVGDYSVSLTVEDDTVPTPLFDVNTFSLHVVEHQERPEATSAVPTPGLILADEGTSTSIAVSYTDANFDVGDTVTGLWLLEGELTTLGSVNTGGRSATFSATLPYDGTLAAGDHAVSLLLNDTYDEGGLYSGAHTTRLDWTLRVRDVNRAPILDKATPVTGGVKFLSEGGAPLEFLVTAHDPDGDGLQYAWTFDSAPLPMVTAASYTYTPDYASGGTHALAVAISDGRTPPKSVSASWSLSVTEVNRAPQLLLQTPKDAAITLPEGGSSTLGVTVSDPDDDPLQFVWSIDGSRLEEEHNGTLSFHPGFDFVESGTTRTVVVRVTIGDTAAPPATVFAQWTMVVSDVDRPTEIRVDGPPAGERVGVGKPVHLDASATEDPDGDSLRYAWTFGDGAAATGPITAHGYDAVGSYAIQLRVTATHNDAEVVSTWSTQVEVVAGSLGLSDVTLDPARGVTVGTNVTIRATLANRGDLDATSVHIAVEVDGKPLTVLALSDPVAAGAVTIVTLVWLATLGSHLFTLTIEESTDRSYVIATRSATSKPLTVTPARDDHGGGPDGKNVLIPGGNGMLLLVALGVIVAVLGLVLVLSRRRRPVDPKEEAPAPIAALPPPPPPRWHPSAPPPMAGAAAASVAAASAARASTPEPIAAVAAMPTVESFRLEDIFLISTDGRLIAHKAYSDADRVDEQIVSGMLTAITAALTDSLRREGALESMRYGEYTVLFHTEVGFALAVVIQGKETSEIRGDIEGIGRAIARDYGGVLQPWDGDLGTFTGVTRYFAPLEQRSHRSAAGFARAEGKETLRILSAVEFYQGFVRMKVAVKNNSDTIVTDSQLKILYNRTALHLDHVEPEYPLDGSEVLLGNVAPGEKKTVAFYLDPMICMESAVDGLLTYKDAKGKLAHTEMKRRTVEIACPIFYTKQTVNLAMLKRLVGAASYNDSKVYQVPRGVGAQEALEVAKEAISGHDVRPVRTFEEHVEGSYIGEAWYYGAAQATNEEIVIRATVRQASNTLEIFVACSNLASLTGLLAELGHALNRVLVQKRGGGAKPTLVSDVALKDEVRRSTALLDRLNEAELGGDETEQSPRNGVGRRSDGSQLVGSVAIDDLED